MYSRLYLAKLESAPTTILEHLIAHFSRIPTETWKTRIAQGLVMLQDGTPVLADTPYQHGATVLYRREVREEPPVVEAEAIVYQDASILVADKPHGMPVTPAGDYVERSLLARLQSRTGLPTLAPMHRLDRDTAGVVLFAVNPAERADYHRLFASGVVRREYVAVSQANRMPEERHWRVESRIIAGEPWYRQRNGEGPANAVTVIDLIEVREDRGLFRLLPESGKKHQLRLHMASIGFPIVGDTLYPAVRQQQDGEPPLQLLARRLSFADPLSGLARDFVSSKALYFPS